MNWDLYSYKMRPGFHASNEPVEGDLLHASALGIQWSPSDTDFCEAQANIGRKAVTCDDANEDCKYPQSDDKDVLVTRIDEQGNTQWVLRPISLYAREWFSVHYAEHQRADGCFVFKTEEIIPLSQAASNVPLCFVRDY